MTVGRVSGPRQLQNFLQGLIGLEFRVYFLQLHVFSSFRQSETKSKTPSKLSIHIELLSLSLGSKSCFLTNPNSFVIISPEGEQSIPHKFSSLFRHCKIQTPKSPFLNSELHLKAKPEGLHSPKFRGSV